MELNITVFSLFNEKRFKDLEKEIYWAFTKEIQYLDDLDTCGRLEGLIHRFIIKYRLKDVEVMFSDKTQAVGTITRGNRKRHCLLYTMPVKGSLKLLNVLPDYYPKTFFNVKAALEGDLLRFHLETDYKKDSPHEAILECITPNFIQMQEDIIQACINLNGSAKSFNVLLEREITRQLKAKHLNAVIKHRHNNLF